MYECQQCGVVFNQQPLILVEADNAYFCCEKCRKDYKRFLETVRFFEPEQTELPFVPP